NGSDSNTDLPVQVRGAAGNGFLTGVAAVAAGEQHSIALKSDGTVWTWGSNLYGQLGNGTFDDSLTPVQVRGPGGVGFLTDIQAIAAGYAQNYALRSDGTVWTWGNNGAGQLGDGTSDDRSTPVQVKGPGGSGFLTGIRAIAAGNSAYALALRS